jgi:hypothetical protein
MARRRAFFHDHTSLLCVESLKGAARLNFDSLARFSVDDELTMKITAASTRKSRAFDGSCKLKSKML